MTKTKNIARQKRIVKNSGGTLIESNPFKILKSNIDIYNICKRLKGFCGI